MKMLLIIVNLMLALGIVYQGYRLCRPTHAGSETVTATKRERQNRAAARNTAAAPKMDLPEALSMLREKSVFDSSRCPDAVGGNSGSTTVLLGIYRIGGRVGCVIEQRRRGARSWGQGRRRNERGANRNNTTRPYKSFLRVGEALENGYVLSEVYDDRVILSRGGGRMELKLERASLNTAQARAARNRAAAQRNRPPSAQQIQQNMMNQQMRMMGELLRMNRDQAGRNNNNRGRSGQSSRGRR